LFILYFLKINIIFDYKKTANVYENKKPLLTLHISQKGKSKFYQERQRAEGIQAK